MKSPLAILLATLTAFAPTMGSATKLDPKAPEAQERVERYNQEYLDFCSHLGLNGMAAGGVYVEPGSLGGNVCRGTEKDWLWWTEFYEVVEREDLAELEPSPWRQAAGVSGIGIGLLSSVLTAATIPLWSKRVSDDTQTKVINIGVWGGLILAGLGAAITPWERIDLGRTITLRERNRGRLSKDLVLKHNEELVESLGLAAAPNTHPLAVTELRLVDPQLPMELLARFERERLNVLNQQTMVMTKPTTSVGSDGKVTHNPGAVIPKARRVVSQGKSQTPIPWPTYYALVGDASGIERLEERRQTRSTAAISATGFGVVGNAIMLNSIARGESTPVSNTLMISSLLIGGALTAWAVWTDPNPSRAELTGQVDIYNRDLLESLKSDMNPASQVSETTATAPQEAK